MYMMFGFQPLGSILWLQSVACHCCTHRGSGLAGLCMKNSIGQELCFPNERKGGGGCNVGPGSTGLVYG